MRSLWQRFIQSIFGKSDPLQGDWLGWEELDDCHYCDSSCEDCPYWDSLWE